MVLHSPLRPFLQSLTYTDHFPASHEVAQLTQDDLTALQVRLSLEDSPYKVYATNPPRLESQPMPHVSYSSEFAHSLTMYCGGYRWHLVKLLRDVMRLTVIAIYGLPVKVREIPP